MAIGIVLTIVGRLILASAGEIFQLYHNGPETCTTIQPVDRVPTCASTGAQITTLAIVGIVFLAVAGIILS